MKEVIEWLISRKDENVRRRSWVIQFSFYFLKNTNIVKKRTSWGCEMIFVEYSVVWWKKWKWVSVYVKASLGSMEDKTHIESHLPISHSFTHYVLQCSIQTLHFLSFICSSMASSLFFQPTLLFFSSWFSHTPLFYLTFLFLFCFLFITSNSSKNLQHLF